MVRTSLNVLAVLFFAGIAAASEQPPGQSAPAADAPIGRWLQPSREPVSPEARIFLVAGARDIANFAQEVVDQKRHWLARGYAPEQIACFYAAPPPDQRADAGQFLALEEALRECHLASPVQVYRALAQVAADYKDDHFYLYVTSHGNRPALELSDALVRRLDPQAAWLPQALTEARTDAASPAHQWLSPFQIAMEGIALDEHRWGWASYLARLRQSRLDSGMNSHEHLFTPRLLAAALQAFPAGVRKIVVIQACYSGGFVLAPEAAPAPEETLQSVPDITVLTASRADRTSFGCDSSGDTTYYGRSFQSVLDASGVLRIPELDWQQLHAQVTGEVERLEQQAGIADRMRSLPQFYSDAAAPNDAGLRTDTGGRRRGPRGRP